MRIKVLLARARAAGTSATAVLCASHGSGGGRKLAAIKHPAPSSLIRCDPRHALRLGEESKGFTATAGAGSDPVTPKPMACTVSAAGWR